MEKEETQNLNPQLKNNKSNGRELVAYQYTCRVNIRTK